MFRVPNYESNPDGSKEIDDNGRVQCYCGRRVWPFVLVDTKPMNNVKQDWACDACWTDWQRNRFPLTKGEIPNNRKEWDEQWLRLHGAPQSTIDAMKQTNRRA